jgi:hypothetical protein
MTLERARKLLAVGEDTEMIAINRKAAQDLDAYLVNVHKMLLGVEQCKQTVDEFREMLIRLYPEAKRLMQHTVGVNRVITAVAEHLFLAGSGDPKDVAMFRYQAKQLADAGQLSLVD